MSMAKLKNDAIKLVYFWFLDTKKSGDDNIVVSFIKKYNIYLSRDGIFNMNDILKKYGTDNTI